jgi:ElaB/YqjD/DUF883 family membrane-anchored ribosome-binding protein
MRLEECLNHERKRGINGQGERRKVARVKTTARHAADRTDKFVHSNPWSVIGGAVAAAAAIAMLLRMRTRR